MLRVERRVHVDFVTGTATSEAVNVANDASRGRIVRLWDQCELIDDVAHWHDAALQAVSAADHLQHNTASLSALSAVTLPANYEL